MDILNLINENIINLELEVDNQQAAIEEMADLLMKEDKIESREDFIEGILKREEESTTGFGKGIAIPHCKIETVKEPSIAIGKLKEGVDWNSMDGEPVKFIIMLAVPDKEGGSTHLKILSALSRKLMKKKFVEELLNADTPGKIINLLADNIA